MYAVSSLTGVQVKACQVSSCVFVCLSLFWMGLKKVIMCNSFDTWGGVWVTCLFKIKNNLASLEGLQACAACLKVKPEFLNLTWVQTLTRTLLFFFLSSCITQQTLSCRAWHYVWLDILPRVDRVVEAAICWSESWQSSLFILSFTSVI